MRSLSVMQRRTRLAALLSFGLGFGLAAHAVAQTGTWNTTAGGNWSDSLNWDVVPNGADAIANFNAQNITADRTVVVDVPITVGTINFQDITTASNNQIFNSSGGSILTLATSTGKPVINVIGNTATFNVALDGSNGFTKTGTGTMILSNPANTITGGIVIGTTTATGANTLTVGANEVIPDSNIVTLSGSSGTVSFFINGFTETIAGLNTTGGSTRRVAGNAAAMSTLILNVAPATTLTYGSQVGQAAGTANINRLAITKTGAGLQELTNTTNLSHFGDTTITEGALGFALANGPLNSLVILNGGVFQNSGTVTTFTRSIGTTAGANGVANNSFNWTANGGGFSAKGAKLTVNIGSGATVDWGATVGTNLVGTLMFGHSTSNNEVEWLNTIQLNGATRTINVADNTASTADFTTITGNIVNGSGAGGLNKTGAGLLALNGTNTYSGVTTINEGALRANKLVSLPGYATPGGVNIVNGRLAVRAGGVGEFDTASLNTLAANVTANAGSILEIETTAATTALSAAIADPDTTLNKTGTGTLAITTAQTYNGGTNINAGVLQAGANDIFGTGIATIGAATLSSTNTSPRTLSNPLAISGNSTFGDLTNTGALTFNNASPVDLGLAARNLTFNSNVTWAAGYIGAGSPGYLAQKLGPGTLTLGGTTTQNGALEVRDGLVIVDTGATMSVLDAIRVMSTVPSGTARMEIRGTVTMPTSTGNVRIGHESSNNPTATNILDVYGTYDLTSYTTGGFTQLGSDSLSAILNLHNNSSYKTRAINNATADLNSAINIVNFDGGTLVAAENGATILSQLNGVGGGVYLQANGAKIDSNSFSVIAAAPLLHDPALGASPDGGLTKVGTGRVALSGASTYTGPTTISAGELAIGAGGLTGSIGSLSIVNNATLVLNRADNFTFSNNISGTGGLTKEGTNTATINGTNTYAGPTLINAGRLDIATPLSSNITVADGAAVGGESTITGTLTVGTSLGGSIVANASTPGFFQVNGQVTLVGNTTVAITNPGSGTGIVVLGSTLPIIGSVPTLGNPADFRAGTNLSFNGTNTQVLLNLVTANVKWVGGTVGFESVWDSNGVSNWDNGGSSDKFFAGDTVTFDDTALNFTPTIAVNVTPGSVTFNNSTNNYTLSGAGGITGDGALTKQGTGTVILTTPNTYTGVTTISGGTLQLGNGIADGTIGNGNIVNNANLTLNLITDTTINNLISGTGSVTSNGTSTITLNAMNTYDGVTTVNAGTVKMVNLSSLGTTTGGTTVGDAGRLLIGGTIPVGSTINEAITLTGGPNNAQADLHLTDARLNITLNTPLVSNGDASVLTDTGTSFLYTGGITTNAGVLTFNAVGAQTVNSNITGAGGIGKTGTGTLNLNGAGTYAGGVNVSAGTLNISTPTALGTGTFTIGGGATFNNTSGAAMTLTTNNAQSWNGTVIFTGTNDLDMGTGAVTLTSDVLLTVNNTGILTVGGVISGGFNLTKNNAGNLRLTGANTFTGKFNIANGLVEVSALGDGINGATTIGLSNNTNPATLRYIGSSNATLGAARSIELGSANGVSGAATSRLENNGTGTLVFNGGVTVQATTAANQTFVLAGSNTGNNTIAGNITNGGDTMARTVAIQKDGTGKWILSGTNTNTGQTTVRNGVLEVTGSISSGGGNLNIGVAAGERGIALLTGTGSITANNIQFGNNAGPSAGALYQSGTSTLTQTAGVGTGNFALGNNAGNHGYYKLSGGTATVNEAGIGASGNGNGVMEVTGGTFTTNNFFNVGRGTNQAGIVNISGGTVQMVPGSANNTTLNGGTSSNNLAVINLSGGNLLTGTARGITLNSNASGSNNTAIVNLSGTGTLTTNQVTSGAATTGTGRIALMNFNGGTLRAQGTAPTNFINIINDGIVADVRSGTYLYAGGATIDTNAVDTTISNALNAPTGSGVTAVTIPIALANRGAGYIGAPVVSLTGGGGIGATAIANMEDDGSGLGTYRVASITITNPGLDYTSAPTVNWIDNTSVYTAQAVAPVLAGGDLSANASGGLTKIGAGILTLTNANTYTGTTTISAGTLQLGNGTTGNDGTISNSPSVVNNAALVYNRFGSASYGGAISGTGTVSAIGPGTQILTGTNTYLGGTTISAGTLQVGNGGSTGTLGSGPVTNNASLVVNRTGTLTTGTIDGTGTTTVTATGANLTAGRVRQSTLDIGAGNTVTVATNGGNSGTSVVTNLNINATGKLDLNDNDLVVDNGNLTTLTAKLASGLDINGTYGNGPGITSSAFASNPNFNTVLGIAANVELGYTSFSGQTVDANDILIKYTYYGDADLSGSVDTSTDFDLYITGLTSGGSLGGWLFGDFDYSGTVDSSTDFDLYITGLTTQGGALLTAGGGGNLVQAVPEPSTFVLGGLALLGFAGVGLRRRRLAKQPV